MKLFKRKKSLVARIRSIENFLGLFYAEDSWGGLEHRQEVDSYSVLQQLQKDVKELLKAADKGKK